MPEWIHNRAVHLLAKNPDMKKSTAFAVATQQAEATGHTPKGYGTAEGRATSKAKYDTPKDDMQTANPGHLSTPHLKAAGIRVDYDVDFKPVSSHTHDEWLAGMFKRDGAFHVPGMLDHVSPLGKYGMAGFLDELEKIGAVPPPLPAAARAANIARKAVGHGASDEGFNALMSGFKSHQAAGKANPFAHAKLSSVVDTAKKVLTTPIEGTPDLLPHGALEAIKRFGSGTMPAVAAKKPPVDWRAARAAAFR